MSKIVFFNAEEEDIIFFDKEFRKNYDLKFYKRPLCEFSAITEEIKDANIISCFTTSELNEKILSNCYNYVLCKTTFPLARVDFTFITR